MNKKAILVITMILGLVVLVPLVAASPLLQNQNGDTLKVQDQTQLQDCDCDETICDGTQTQTRERFGQQECGQAGVNGGQQNCNQFQQKNCQAP